MYIQNRTIARWPPVGPALRFPESHVVVVSHFIDFSAPLWRLGSCPASCAAERDRAQEAIFVLQKFGLSSLYPNHLPLLFIGEPPLYLIEI